ncbi:choice-of-anchor D domain-containing protein [Ruegeria sp. 2012CJ41-6]|uniref:Choice-of-anchor D domain-containing protein n=1 Tax=Ruegeria spongiae TaxID=2942209 RepID=A0ABT0PYG1_9RHOB|nr:choice-of-anchor D domain-containing protein [Ruegeria spongiae]MCL6282620.1 choice-of-anchor D domain-containing protein [Ruegeria spongiae]
MIPGTVWKPIGPSPITGGREDNGLITSIATHPSDPDIVYVGTADGGIWKTGDGGANWLALFDEELCLAIGEPNCVAIDPGDTDVIYVGTSTRGAVSVQQRVGIFKSFDGGSSWILLGSGYPEGNDGNADDFANRNVNSIVVDPANSQIVYAATSSGVWVSNDGGQNWVQGAGTATFDARSLELDTTSPAGARILYTGMSRQGVFQSTDGGANWAPIMTTATPAVAAVLGGGVVMGQVLARLAPPTSPPAVGGIQVIYAVIAHNVRGSNPDPIGLFMSTDQGATWTQQAAAGAAAATTFAGYCMTLAVDPASPGDGANDILYWGTQNQVRSSDSGANFANVSNGLHADTHAWGFFQPPAPASTTVYCGNDGGIFRSTDDGATWTALNSGGFQTTLIYNMDIKPGASGDVTVAGFQDNGHKRTNGALGWTSIGGADGWDIVYDGVTADRMLFTRNGGNPATRVRRSTDDGGSNNDVTPWAGGSAEDAFYLASLAADPGNDGVFYVASNANIWQSLDGGVTWRAIFPIASGFVTPRISVSPTNGNNVVVSAGSQVFVSTNAMAATVGLPNGVTFTNITRNLPGRNVTRSAFDPNDETAIFSVLGGFATAFAPGHVFRTTIGGTQWADISPDVNVPFGAIALDGDETPSTIYAGCDLGVLRSVDRGNTWYVLDDLHFPNAPVTDIVVGRGSNVLRAATYGRGVFEFAAPEGPVIAVNLEDRFEFGRVCEGPVSLTLQIFNVGTEDLIIKSVQRILGSTAFNVEAFPSTPLSIAPGGEVDFTLTYTPSAPGATDLATIRIASNDPESPTVDLLASGEGGTAAAELSIADSGDFGEVCVGKFRDQGLVINNSGHCPLLVSGIASSAPEFFVPNTVSFPLKIAPGASMTLPLRYQPTAFGNDLSVITVSSNDPDSPAQLEVRGTAPPPRLVLSFADDGDFGKVCVDHFSDKTLVLSNSGKCPLTITAISSNSAEFIVPQVLTFPIVIASGAAVPVTIRFQPTSFGPKAGTNTVVSDDPASPATIDLTGFAPSGKLTITGTGCFGGVELGTHALTTFAICNTGDCDLHVTKVGFKPPSRCEELSHCDNCGCDCDCGCDCGCKDDGYGKHGRKKPHCDQKCLNFKIVSNPFPATVKPGSCLDLIVKYTPTCNNSACCKLVVRTDDPDNRKVSIFVTGHLKRTLHSALKCWAGQELSDMIKAGKSC